MYRHSVSLLRIGPTWTALWSSLLHMYSTQLPDAVVCKQEGKPSVLISAIATHVAYCIATAVCLQVCSCLDGLYLAALC